MKSLLPTALVLQALSALGCGGTATTCPNDLPQSCVSPAPTYADVAPAIDRGCMPCHGPNGVAASRPLVTYDDVFRIRTTVLSLVYGCVMPPADAPPLTANDRRLLLSWLVCHAPP